MRVRHHRVAFTQTGVYVLELRAIDATGQEGSDRIEVRVCADGCEAARSDPTGVYVAPLYDFKKDCWRIVRTSPRLRRRGQEQRVSRTFPILQPSGWRVDF